MPSGQSANVKIRLATEAMLRCCLRSELGFIMFLVGTVMYARAIVPEREMLSSVRTVSEGHIWCGALVGMIAVLGLQALVYVREQPLERAIGHRSLLLKGWTIFRASVRASVRIMRRKSPNASSSPSSDSSFDKPTSFGKSNPMMQGRTEEFTPDDTASPMHDFPPPNGTL